MNLFVPESFTQILLRKMSVSFAVKKNGSTVRTIKLAEIAENTGKFDAAIIPKKNGSIFTLKIQACNLKFTCQEGPKMEDSNLAKKLRVELSAKSDDKVFEPLKKFIEEIQSSIVDDNSVELGGIRTWVSKQGHEMESLNAKIITYFSSDSKAKSGDARDINDLKITKLHEKRVFLHENSDIPEDACIATLITRKLQKKAGFKYPDYWLTGSVVLEIVDLRKENDIPFLIFNITWLKISAKAHEEKCPFDEDDDIALSLFSQRNTNDNTE